MSILTEIHTRVVKHNDPEQQRAYALGAFETVQYIYDLSRKIENPEGLKRLIEDEYDLARTRLHDAIMPPYEIVVEKDGNAPTSEEGERDG